MDRHCELSQALNLPLSTLKFNAIEFLSNFKVSDITDELQTLQLSFPNV